MPLNGFKEEKAVNDSKPNVKRKVFTDSSGKKIPNVIKLEVDPETGLAIMPEEFDSEDD